MFLEVLVEKKAFRFSKRVLRAGTARNKRLKEALIELEKLWVFFLNQILFQNYTY